MICFESVSKTYANSIHALQNVSFSIQSGELIFVAGHSGAGKSTVLKLIAGIIKPTSGNILINNAPFAKFSEGLMCAYRQQIGIVFQDHKILFDRNVLQNVLLPLRISGCSYLEAEKRARIALEKVVYQVTKNPVHAAYQVANNKDFVLHEPLSTSQP